MSDRLPGDMTVEPPRIDNADGGEHCRFCCGNAPGVVVVGTEHTDSRIPHVAGGECPGCVEQMGPCPACMIGKNLEYSKLGIRQWGRDGFWQGLEHDALKQLQPTCTCKEERLSGRENLRRAQELMGTLTSALAEKTSELDQPRPARREDDLCACGHPHTSGRSGSCSSFLCDCKDWRDPATDQDREVTDPDRNDVML